MADLETNMRWLDWDGVNLPGVSGYPTVPNFKLPTLIVFHLFKKKKKKKKKKNNNNNNNNNNNKNMFKTNYLTISAKTL